MREYYPNKRINDPAYLMRHVNELLKIAKEHQNSSSLIYACLDSRITLEYIDLYLILASVKPEEFEEIRQASRPKNGIDRVNNKQKTLKEKYQIFFQTIAELVGVSWNNYDFKKSKDLQHKLSGYIHSYYMLDEELAFDSTTMQTAFPLIHEVQEFVKKSLNFNEDGYHIIGIEMSTIPQEDKDLLVEWKDTNSMSVDDLRAKLTDNIQKRIK